MNPTAPFDFYQNCRGLRSKLDLFKRNVSVFNYILVCNKVIKFTDRFYDRELGVSNYFVLRCDRNILTNNCRRGGGVLIAIRNETQCNLLPTCINNVEHIFLTIIINVTVSVNCNRLLACE